MRLGEMVDVSMRKKREEDTERILAQLRPLAGDHKLNQVLVDRMILNAAFLVDGEREREFDRALQQLDDEMGQRLLLKYVGPVPPYNFVSIVIS
jgi:Gas vesicle synthesis protein GvpL/GvpF